MCRRVRQQRMRLSSIRLIFLWLLVPVLAAPAQRSPTDLVRQADKAYRSGDPDRAATLFRQVLEQDPSFLPAHMLLGIISAQRNQWDEAITHLEAVVGAEPSNAHAHFLLGTAYRSKGKWAEAVQRFSKALENQFPDRDRLIVALAQAQAQSGDPRQSLASLQMIQEPSDERLAAQYHAAGAFAKAQLDQPAAAIEAIKSAVALDGYNPQYRRLLITSLLGSGRNELALTEAILAQKRFPDHPGIQYQFGLAAYYVPESPFTKLALRNLREARPEDPRATVLEGLLKHKRGQIQEAKHAFAAAAERGVPAGHLFLGGILWAQGDLAGAERELRKAERQLPHNGLAFLELAKVLSVSSPDEALGRLLKAERYMPTNPAVHYRLYFLYLRLNEQEKANHHMRRFKELKQEERQMIEALMTAADR